MAYARVTSTFTLSHTDLYAIYTQVWVDEADDAPIEGFT